MTPSLTHTLQVELASVRAERDQLRATLEQIAQADTHHGQYGTHQPTWQELRGIARRALRGTTP